MKNQLEERLDKVLQGISPQGSSLDQAMDDLVRDPEFDAYFASQARLGTNYQAEATSFHLWAPLASEVSLLIYQDLYSNQQAQYPMQRQERGVFSLDLPGDWHNTAYLYKVSFPNGKTNFTRDPYAIGATQNSQRSVVVDLARTNPTGWDQDQSPALKSLSQAVIYEASVRDLTSADNSGVKPKLRGKFLGLSQKKTKTPQGQTTGLDYLKDLGISHLQLLPMADFKTVIEGIEDGDNYNWGYDPADYNVPEGSYATDSADPICRIKEMKTMVQSLHQAGIRVIMDVVYNHVYDYLNHPLQLTVPNYYFRRDPDGTISNGTGVGNDTASERRMMREYIVRSVCYWAKEYHIDGFRFDLMGIHDVKTMNKVRQALDEIDPSILILGEGWNLGTYLPDEDKACLVNAYKTPRIAYFDDHFRDSVKGSDQGEGRDTGYASGKFSVERTLLASFLGGERLNKLAINVKSPLQLVKYVAAHDNWTLWDKLAISHSFESQAKRQKRQLLANSLVLLSQGIPFLHAGQEFFRTKQGVRNSYRHGDRINQIDWSLRNKHQDAVNYLSDLIRFRQVHPVFHLTDFESIDQAVEVLKADFQIIALLYHGEDTDYLLVFNGQTNTISFTLPEGDWQVLAENYHFRSADEEKSLLSSEHPLVVEELSLSILKQQGSEKA